MTLDLNSDVGEGAPDDEALIPWVTSVNIACGAHAGDEPTMRRTLSLARAHGVAPGAHPGYRDRPHFGRRELALPANEVFHLVREQVALLQSLAAGMGLSLTHVKPHGALYLQAARDAHLAEAIAAAVFACNPRLILFGLSGSALIDAARARGLAVAGEIFADRRYQPDGSLTPRSQPDALLTDPAEACAQVLRLLREGRAQTVCVHGDHPLALNLARELRSALREAGIEVRNFS